MRACREAGALQDAFSVYHGMRVVGLRPDNKQFQQLLSACADVVVEDAHGEAGGRNASGLDVERQVYPALYATFLQGPVDLDLHGLSVREARVAVLTVLRAAMHAYKRGQRGKRRKVMLDDFVIITGSGQHSGEQGPRLRDEILRYETFASMQCGCFGVHTSYMDVHHVYTQVVAAGAWDCGDAGTCAVGASCSCDCNRQPRSAGGAAQ